MYQALYRRAKAHVGAWNPSQAKQDFTRVMQLDETLAG
jgi:AH receptor-interacting protein